jgi:hypothetical protein
MNALTCRPNATGNLHSHSQIWMLGGVRSNMTFGLWKGRLGSSSWKEKGRARGTYPRLHARLLEGSGRLPGD